MEWKFNNVTVCDKCKYDCNSTEHCPYTAGWKDGQEKLLKYLLDRFNDGDWISSMAIKQMLEENK
jgi:hypothetical protein